MFKICAMAALFIGTGFAGIIKSSELKERIRLLEDFLQMILDIKSYISYFREPLITIYSDEEKNCGSEAFKLFDSVRADIAVKDAEISQIWSQNVSLIYEGTCLDDEDMEILKYPGCFIGQSDYDNQTARFEYLEKRLAEQIEKARQSYMIKGPLYRKLGFFAGGLAVIILI